MIEKVVHLKPRIIRETCAIRTLPVPRPLVHQVRRQLSLHHLYDVLAQHGKELIAVKGTASGHIQALGPGVRRDDEIAACSESVPARRISLRRSFFDQPGQ